MRGLARCLLGLLARGSRCRGTIRLLFQPPLEAAGERGLALAARLGRHQQHAQQRVGRHQPQLARQQHRGAQDRALRGLLLLRQRVPAELHGDHCLQHVEVKGGALPRPLPGLRVWHTEVGAHGNDGGECQFRPRDLIRVPVGARLAVAWPGCLYGDPEAQRECCCKQQEAEVQKGRDEATAAGLQRGPADGDRDDRGVGEEESACDSRLRRVRDHHAAGAVTFRRKYDSEAHQHRRPAAVHDRQQRCHRSQIIAAEVLSRSEERQGGHRGRRMPRESRV
mmetsp:Transcript_18879/g.48462  ORF Transcript_18879/g.48462 Transcript_18879/m.48462 type:complete len:280 (+) Transcript_18879:1017-1856(+)